MIFTSSWRLEANIDSCSGLLGKARMVADGRGQEVLNSASVITSLLPHIMASVACMASTDTVAAVKVG